MERCYSLNLTISIYWTKFSFNLTLSTLKNKSLGSRSKLSSLVARGLLSSNQGAPPAFGRRDSSSRAEVRIEHWIRFVTGSDVPPWKQLLPRVSCFLTLLLKRANHDCKNALKRIFNSLRFSVRIRAFRTQPALSGRFRSESRQCASVI